MKKIRYIIGIMIVCGGFTKTEAQVPMENPQVAVKEPRLTEEGEEDFVIVCSTAMSIRIACVVAAVGVIAGLTYLNFIKIREIGTRVRYLVGVTSVVIGLISLYSAVLALLDDQVSLTLGAEEMTLPSWSLNRGLWRNILFLYTHPVRTAMVRVPYDTIDFVEKKGGGSGEESKIKLPLSIVITCKDGRRYWIPYRYLKVLGALDELVEQLRARGVTVV